MDNKYIAALDIGTTKVVVAVAICRPDGFEVIGVGQAPSLGMKQGAVVNIEATAEAVDKARKEAESIAGTPIRSVWLGVGGIDISSFDSSGMVAIRRQEVSHEDITRVIGVAQAVVIPNDRRVLHVLPTGYTIDNQSGICDPIGMSGVRLEAKVHIITGPQAAIQNSLRCTENAGLKVSGLVLQSLASSMAVLSGDEKSMGVTVVDVGGGTSDLITYHQGSVVHTGVIPIGGKNFTKDVAVGLRTTPIHGEELKKKWGCVLPDSVSKEEVIESEEARTINRRDLCAILGARTEELLSLILSKVQSANLVDKLGSGVVITGGASHLQGFVEMGDFLFDIPVRQGFPCEPRGFVEALQGGDFATVTGLLIYGDQEQKKVKKVLPQGEVFVEKWTGVSTKVKNYLSGLF